MFFREFFQWFYMFLAVELSSPTKCDVQSMARVNTRRLTGGPRLTLHGICPTTNPLLEQIIH